MDIFYSNYNTKPIGDFMKLLCDNNLELECKKYLNDNNLNINVRIFLISFHIYGYSNELDIDKLKLIYIVSGTIVSKFRKNELTQQLLDSFETIYLEWSRDSVKDLITELCIQYFDLLGCSHRVVNEKITTIDSSKIVEQIENVKERIFNLKGGEIIFNTLSTKLSDLKINNDDCTSCRLLCNELYETIRTGFEYIGSETDVCFKKAYWDLFTYEQLSDSLISVKDVYKSIVINSEILTYEINELIDNEFICQQIKYTNYDYNKLIVNIFELIRKIDSPHGCSQIDKWLDNWNNIQQYDLNIEEIMPCVLRDIINKLECIKLIKDNIMEIYKNNQSSNNT